LIVTTIITMAAIPMIMVCKIIALVEYFLTFSARSCVILIISPVTLIVDVPIIHVELGLLQVELLLIPCPGIDSIDGALYMPYIRAGHLGKRYGLREHPGAVLVVTVSSRKDMGKGFIEQSG
jgi:hypothetical protein